MTKPAPADPEGSTDAKRTRKKQNTKFKRERLALDHESSIVSSPRCVKRNLRTPKRQRKISVSRSSQVILERKRRRSVRIKTETKNEKEKISLAESHKKAVVKNDQQTDEGNVKRELGRKCKRECEAKSEGERNAKRKKTDNTKSVAKRKYKIVKRITKARKNKGTNLTSTRDNGKTSKPCPNQSPNSNQAANFQPSSTHGSCKSSSNYAGNSKNAPNQCTNSELGVAQGSSKISPNHASNLKSSPNHAFSSKLSPNYAGSSKPSPSCKASPNYASSKASPSHEKAETLLDKDFSEDSSDDEEYKPNEEELNELDDTLGDKSVNEEVDEEIDKQTVEEETVQTTPDGVHYMTRSKVSYTDKALEDIEQAFIPPDIDLDMYDCVIDDQDWKDFLTEFTKPIDKINTNEDDDTEFIPNLQEEEQFDSEEFRQDPGVKVSKKELNELMGELFELDEIYDCDNNEEASIDANINDYVNLKFNETVHDVSVNTLQKTKETPKKVAFQDTNTSAEKQPVRKQSVENSGKGRRKITPDKGKTKSTALSDEINKQIMDEINRELNKYIQINETYVYKGAPTEEDVTENYDNYEEYIVIIGNQEPSAEEINKLAQVKMAKDETTKSSEGKTDGDKVGSSDDVDLVLKTSDQDSSKGSQQELSLQLVQKKRIPKQIKKEKKEVTKKPPKPVKTKAELINDNYYNYGKITKRQFKEIYEAYVNGVEMYKENYGVQEDEMSYHKTIVEYAIPLYEEDFKRAGLLPDSNITRKQPQSESICVDASSNSTSEDIRSNLSQQPGKRNSTVPGIKTEINHTFSTDKNVPDDIPMKTEPVASEASKVLLFEEEDLCLLRQQINQHIQYNLQHFLQTYNHPRHWKQAPQAKSMIQTFHAISRTKPSESFYNSLNIQAAMNIITTWETIHSNAAFKNHIDSEWSRVVCEWRSHSDTLALPSPVINTILDSAAFIYPLLLPSKSFEPKPRKIVNPLSTTCELNLAVLGFINYAHKLRQHTKFDRHLVIYDILKFIQEHYLPAHSVKHLAKKLYDLIASQKPNVVQDFFHRGKTVEYQHFIIDYNTDNVVTPRRQHWQLLPAAWQQCVSQGRRGC